MPKAVHDCVNKIKGEKGEDSAWAICNDSVKQEVAAAIGMTESHNPLDIPLGYEVNETHIKIDNSHSGKKALDRMSENVIKQLLEIQLGECSCKNKNRRKA